MNELEQWQFLKRSFVSVSDIFFHISAITCQLSFQPFPAGAPTLRSNTRLFHDL
jgi:hypothetical protein